MIERATDLMVFVEQRAREELPAGIVGIPKGTFERAKDRTFLDCAIREFCEETCADARIFARILIGRWAMLFNRKDARILYVFACVVDAFPHLACGPEIARIMYLDARAVAQLPKKSMSKETAQIARLIAGVAHTQRTPPVCESLL